MENTAAEQYGVTFKLARLPEYSQSNKSIISTRCLHECAFKHSY